MTDAEIRRKIENSAFFESRYKFLFNKLHPEGEWSALKEAMINEELTQYIKRYNNILRVKNECLDYRY